MLFVFISLVAFPHFLSISFFFFFNLNAIPKLSQLDFEVHKEIRRI